MTTQRRIHRLLAYVEQAAMSEAKNGQDRTANDLRALARFLETVPTALQAAADVPEWGNHENERTGKPNGLGTVAATYGLWIDDAGIEHDGASQLAKMAEALEPMLNTLDSLHFRG
jgi:hypothetical protein